MEDGIHNRNFKILHTFVTTLTTAEGKKDAYVACPATASGISGMCGVDYAACARGEFSPQLVCSGKGKAIIMDYDTGEIQCACGDLISDLYSFVTDPTSSLGISTAQLKKNGWGGTACQYYLCQDNPHALHWSRTDPTTGGPFLDITLRKLPGKWIGGSCGAPNGAQILLIISHGNRAVLDIQIYLDVIWYFVRLQKLLNVSLQKLVREVNELH